MITQLQATRLSTIFSILSTVSWIFAQLPQQYKNFKTKDTSSFSPHFLLLWLLGDLCSLLGCLLTHQLPFQTWLSCYFVFNDLVLVLQYYLYTGFSGKSNSNSNSNNNKNSVAVGGGVVELMDTDNDNETVVVDVDGELVPLLNGINVTGNITGSTAAGASNQHRDSDSTLVGQNTTATTKTAKSNTRSGSNSMVKSLATVTILGSNLVSALYIPQQQQQQQQTSRSTISTISTAATSITSDPAISILSQESLGLTLAYLCTLIYWSSRVPQLYKNQKRRSVEGISPFLFGFALCGNLFYSLSILASPQFLIPGDVPSDGSGYVGGRWHFFMDELPYLLGSGGTLTFDAFYFYQRWVFGVVEEDEGLDTELGLGLPELGSHESSGNGNGKKHRSYLVVMDADDGVSSECLRAEI
ncbi:unnamed protein product [Ambrosiozyma monospora]|uniref:Unnamed protein product n=1 Tax=Ambrosiozyma monospora TaxID=43982 RepID=A0ACB5SUR4_AMBMO|nr:unnamed protein product [Ambrosiozyma monospora]